MDKFELRKEFYDAGIPNVTWKSIELFYEVYGDVPKEKFVLIDFFDTFHNVWNKTTIRKFDYLKKYFENQKELKTIEPENIAEKDNLSFKNTILSRRIEYFKQESTYLKCENDRLKKELAKKDKVIKKYGKLASCLCEFQNAYADCLVEERENE